MAAHLDLNRWFFGPAIGLVAALVGLTAGIKPELAIAAAFMVAFVIVVLADLVAGLALFTFIAFLEIVPFGGPALSFSKALGLLLLISWLTVMTTQRDIAFDTTAIRPVLLILVAMLAWVALSASWAEEPAASITALSRYALNGMLFVIIVTAVRDRASVAKLLAAFVAGAAIAAAYGIASPGRFEAEFGRLESAALDPNELSAVLVPAVALCLFAAVGLVRHPMIRMGAGVVGILCGATIVLTVSRGGLIALAIAMVVAVLVAGRWRAWIAAIVTAVAASVFIFFAGFANENMLDHLESTTQGNERVLEGRVTIWQVAARMAEDNPVIGVGAGNFRNESIHYVLAPGAAPRTDLVIDHPAVVHNTYLEILVETGAIGAALYVSLVLFCLLALARAIAGFKRLQDRDMELLARGLMAAVTGILVADFFISEQFSKALWLLLAICPAMLFVARRAERDLANTR